MCILFIFQAAVKEMNFRGVLGAGDEEVFEITKEETLEQSIIQSLRSSLNKRYIVKIVDIVELKRRIKKTEEKWKISKLSFQNEFNFYRMINNNSNNNILEGIPHLFYQVSEKINEEERYTYIMREFETPPYEQHVQFSINQTKKIIKFLSSFHAKFWSPTDTTSLLPSLTAHLSLFFDNKTPPPFHFTNNNNNTNLVGTHNNNNDNINNIYNDDNSNKEGGEERGGVLVSGGWWRKELRAAVNFNNIEENFFQLCNSFSEFEILKNYKENIKWIAIHLRHINDYQYRNPLRTLIHGDLKPSNIFLLNPNYNNDENNNNNNNNKEEVGVIDYQWSGGANSGAADLAYLFCSGVSFDSIEQFFPSFELNENTIHSHNDWELSLLSYYYENLINSNANIANHYSFEQLIVDYKIEFINYFTTALPQLLYDITPEMMKENYGKHGWLTHEFDRRSAFSLCYRSLLFVNSIKHLF